MNNEWWTIYGLTVFMITVALVLIVLEGLGVIHGGGGCGPQCDSTSYYLGGNG